MGYKYEYRVPTHKVEAQVAGEECERLAKSEAGLSPKTLLDAARPDEAPLHGEFEWEDAVAAEKYRLHQARKIIEDITVTATADEPVVTRAFVSVPQTPTGVYLHVASVMGSDYLAASLMKTARRELEIFSAKYARLSKVSDGIASVLNAVDVFLKAK